LRPLPTLWSWRSGATTLQQPIWRLDEASAYTPGSDDDFDRLYRASYQRVLYTLLAVLGDYHAAEDCAQEAFLRAYRAWPRWKADAPAEAWLHRIALNIGLSHLRWRKLRRLRELLTRFGSPSTEPEPAVVESLGSELWTALRQLAPQQAALVVLRHYHGYSNREIALSLQIPESTVSSRLAAAKHQLRRELGEPDMEGPGREP